MLSNEFSAIEARLEALTASPLPRILMVSHGMGGGVERHVQELITVLAGRAHVIVLRPMLYKNLLGLTLPCLDAVRDGLACPSFAQNITQHEDAVPAEQYMRLAFKWPRDAQALWAFLRALGISRMHIHHVEGYTLSFFKQLLELGIPYDLTLHDHSIFTGHPSLVNAKGCFDPAWFKQGLSALPKGKQAVADALQLLAEHAERVIVPSELMIERLQQCLPQLARQINVLYRAHPEAEWARAYPQPSLRALADTEPLRVLCLGMLGAEKGAHVLARVAQQVLVSTNAFEFILLGSCHLPLPANVQRLGAYEDANVARLVAEIEPHLLWLPAQCPETWSYTLSVGLRAGLPVLASNVGVFPERLQGRPLSWLLMHSASAQEWLALLHEIRQFHLQDAPPEGYGFWHWRAPAAFYYDFLGQQETGRIPGASVVKTSGRYLCCVQKHLPQKQATLAYVQNELRNALLLAQTPEPSWRQKVLRGLLAVRQAPILSPLIRRIPYTWQRAFKRLISRGPLDE
ncbi:glycosyltransferase [Denitrificimonas caeni]|uniref:glycosyltransferase n=1 Tax=Denitrificimonas caeni TaxID=521720 RepID=UPI0019666A21|nr:glycosyltransferase [Denitrificimonas caeni]